jgi:hypothetical protein
VPADTLFNAAQYVLNEASGEEDEQ